MDLDDQARRAAAALRRSAPDDVDVDDALAVVHSGAAGAVPRTRVLASAATFLVVAGLVGALVLFLARTDEEQVRPPDPSAPDTVPVDTVDPDDPRAVLELMPAGPLDGKESWRLPVLVVPQSGLVDRQSVTVLGRGFRPQDRVGVVMCASEAAVEGVAACSLGTATSSYEYVTYATADEDGDVIAPINVRQQIVTPFTGPIDCAAGPERCLVAIGAVSDYDRSGGSFVGFEGAPAFVQPAMLPEPAGPYDAGQDVTVRAVGLVPTRGVELVQCLGDACLLLARGEVAADGTFAATGAVEPVLTDQAGNPLPCGTSCVLRVQGHGLRGASAAPMPADLPIEFTGQFLPAPPPEVETTTTSPPVVETTVTSLPGPTVTTTTTPTMETLPALSTTTTSPVDRPATTRPEPDREPTFEALVEEADLVISARIELGEPVVDLVPERVLKGSIDGPIRLALDGPMVVSNDDAESLMFLVLDETAPEPIYRPVGPEWLLALDDGVVVGSSAPIAQELEGLALDEVAQRIAE